jgi:hypothetical protein
VTDKQRLTLLRSARDHLERTQIGFLEFDETGKGSEWRVAIRKLEQLEKDLLPDPLPALGPVWMGGKGLLAQDLTHATSGLDLYPAFDDAFNQGRVVVAPEDMEVTRTSSSRPGLAFYATGKSKLRYWFGHLDRTHVAGTKFKKGDAVGKVAANTIGGGPHVHVGVNVELLLGTGKELKHHTNYTHGSPTIGEQLRKVL